MTVCTGAAAVIEGTLVNSLYAPRAKQTKVVRSGHPSGRISIEVAVETRGDGPHLTLAAFGRSSRRIMEGFVYVPEKLFNDKIDKGQGR